MYELILKNFSNPDLIFIESKRIDFFDTFVSSFGTLSYSENINKLIELSKKLHPKINTLIIKSKDIKLPQHKEITSIVILPTKIILNSNTEIRISDIISVSVEPIRYFKIKQNIFYESNIEHLLSNDFYFSFKFLTEKNIFWTSKETMFYSKTSLFDIGESYLKNIIRLCFFIKHLNQRVLFTPFSKMFIEQSNYIKYFISDLPKSKEFLWMIKTKTLNI